VHCSVLDCNNELGCCACAASQLVVTVKNATVHRQQAVPSYRCVLLG